MKRWNANLNKRRGACNQETAVKLSAAYLAHKSCCQVKASRQSGRHTIYHDY